MSIPISDGGGRQWTEEERQELCKFMAELFAKQKPLDPRYAQALNDNRWDLYTSEPKP